MTYFIEIVAASVLKKKKVSECRNSFLATEVREGYYQLKMLSLFIKLQFSWCKI